MDIWQRGAVAVEADPKPDPETFEAYIREKIHLLKRRQASGRLTHSTGFLLDAIWKNYINPEFAEEKKQKEARQQAQDRKAKARELAALQEQREQVKRSHSDALHAHWGSRLRRDSWVSVRYAEELNSTTSSVTLRRTDRHGIVVRQVALKRK